MIISLISFVLHIEHDCDWKIEGAGWEEPFSFSYFSFPTCATLAKLYCCKQINTEDLQLGIRIMLYLEI